MKLLLYFKEMYDADVSAGLISRVTSAVEVKICGKPNHPQASKGRRACDGSVSRTWYEQRDVLCMAQQVYGGMDASMIPEMKSLQLENTRLNKDIRRSEFAKRVDALAKK